MSSPTNTDSLRQFPPHTHRIDAVAAEAKNCLRRSPYHGIRHLSCEHERGVLVLRGTVPSFFHKQLAQTAVAGVLGVKRVVNETRVTG